jgi:hypothetical protein
MGREKSSTSLTMRFRRAIFFSMSATVARTSSTFASARFRRRMDALMIMSGLRISCATPVDRWPSDDSRSRNATSRWKPPRSTRSSLKVVASSRHLVVPGRRLRLGNAARQGRRWR